MRCDVCKGLDSYIKDYEHNFLIKGKEIKFIAKRRFCKNCDSLVYDEELDNAASEKAISIYNEKYGISKDLILNLRNKFNLSQDLFSKVIGCAKKTLISYEKGKSIPNDSYLIILNSLIAKPDTIKTLIEANKEQFTEKEYNKINSKISKVLSNNMKQFLYNYDSNPSEYNGYTKLSKDKIYNIILYFSDNLVLKTKLLKEMFYTDFLCYKNTCQSMTGLEYSKLPFGPVPDQFETILNEGVNENYISYDITYNNEYECHKICANKKFDKSIFTDKELNIIKQVKKQFLSYGSKELVEYSHKEKAFTETDLTKKISYDYAFDIEFK